MEWMTTFVTYHISECCLVVGAEPHSPTDTCIHTATLPPFLPDTHIHMMSLILEQFGSSCSDRRWMPSSLPPEPGRPYITPRVEKVISLLGFNSSHSCLSFKNTHALYLSIYPDSLVSVHHTKPLCSTLQGGAQTDLSPVPAIYMP